MHGVIRASCLNYSYITRRKEKHFPAYYYYNARPFTQYTRTNTVFINEPEFDKPERQSTTLGRFFLTYLFLLIVRPYQRRNNNTVLPTTGLEILFYKNLKSKLNKHRSVFAIFRVIFTKYRRFNGIILLYVRNITGTAGTYRTIKSICM